MRKTAIGLATLIWISCAYSDDSKELIEIYDYVGDTIFFVDPPAISEVKEHGKLIFSSADIADLKPVKGFDGRFTLEVKEDAKADFWKLINEGYAGQLVLVINGTPHVQTMHACRGCRVVDSSIESKLLEELRGKLKNRAASPRQIRTEPLR